MTGNTKVQMKKRRLKRWIINIRTILLYGTIGALALVIFFYILIGAILQTSYRLAPVTPQELNMEVMNKWVLKT